jgi:hypothetical protein
MFYKGRVVYMHVVQVKFSNFHFRLLKVVLNYIIYKCDLELSRKKRIVRIKVFQQHINYL